MRMKSVRLEIGIMFPFLKNQKLQSTKKVHFSECLTASIRISAITFLTNAYNKLNSATKYVTHFANYPTDILKFARDKNTVHPTQKPVALLEYLVRTYTKENEVVMDNCMGSGSCDVACKNIDRRFIGIEANDYYFPLAKARIENGYGV